MDNAGLNDVNPDELSGGKWICSFSHEKDPSGMGEYVLEIPAAGRYHLWARAVGGTGLAYRLDGAKDAVNVAVNKGKDEIAVSADGNPYYPGRIAWYDAGSVELTPGKHVITWYLGGLKDKDRYGGMDCFVLTTGDVHAQRQVQARREVAAADPRFPAGPGVGLRPAGRQARPCCRARSPLSQREGGRRARFHPPQPRRQQLPARRRPADPLLGGVSASAPQFDLACAETRRAVPGQARRQFHARWATIP